MNAIGDLGSHILKIRCAAHSVQLLVKDILAFQYFSEGLNKHRQLVDKFSLQVNRQKLREIQRASGVPEAQIKDIQRAVVARWNTEVDSMHRTFALENQIKTILESGDVLEVSEENWATFQEIRNFLSPMALATDAVQSDSATLVTVFSHLHNIGCHLEAMMVHPKTEIQDV